ncbi:hypothetical protein LCGC14_0461900 [marine sediment metagenome]|uniref:Uncharacterized protein n=1 Tax=marine sediment metagenome TaxID=412755 RepID=A0A0F9V1E3_9ZZZZ
MVRNKPTQLEKIRKEHYDKLYGRNPQLMERLVPFLTKAEIIEEFTEPMIETEPRPNGRNLRKRLNKFTHLKKPKKLKKDSRIKKISDIKPDVLWGLK